MPRWVKIFLIVGAVLVLGFAVSHLAGFHGPDLHRPSDGPTGHSPPVQHGP